jgi:glycosyltransferase involved in cell wall biosynthesis
MKIAHIVTLLSPDGAFGGPVRVANNLAMSMQETGHEVTVLGSYRGYMSAPTSVDGVPARLFPARRVLPGLGFSGLIAPGLIRYLRKHIEDFDVVHVHLARDLITLTAAMIARRSGVRYVLQTHGMVDPSHRYLAKVLDRLATRRALCGADTLFHLTEQERTDLEAVAGRSSLPLVFLPNGVPASAFQADVKSGREVLFLARLHARKRPLMFVEAAIKLRKEFPDVQFTLVGADEGQASDVAERIQSADAQDFIAWEGSLDPSKTLERMSRSSLYVLPSLNEPFAMTVLEAMSIGLPSIVTNTCGLIPQLHDPQAVVVVDDTLAGLITEIRRLLSDSTAREDLGRRARREAEANFSIHRVSARAVAAYTQPAG